MLRTILTALVILIPTSVSVASQATAPASFSAAQSLVAASSSPGNSYVAGVSVVLTAPVAGDLSAFGGSVTAASPVSGDDFILAGSVTSRALVTGDFRAVAGRLDIAESIGGDIVAFGFSVRDAGRAEGSVFIVAANAGVSNGAQGPVMIYGNNVTLGGSFADDVTVTAGSHFAIASGTVIHGDLIYEAPEAVTIPASVTVIGKITHKSISFLPDAGTSRVLLLLSIGFFLIIRVLGALILAGLLAGLFPTFAESFITHVYTSRLRSVLLASLLGFAVCVATPIVIALLTLTFVGIGLAFLLLILYLLLFLLAFVYAGILTGGMLMRRFGKREQVLWHDGVLGMAVLSFATLVPFVGIFAVFLLMLFSAGLLLKTFFYFAFPR